MHELSIVEALIEQVALEVEAAGGDGRVMRLELAIGCLSGVHIESLRFAFEVLAPGTLVDGAELEIRQLQARVFCHDCRSQFATCEFVAVCQRCSSGKVRIAGGQEMVLESIELQADG